MEVEPTPPLAAEILLDARGLHKTYRGGGEELRVLRGADLQLRKGDFVALLGNSGSGKSTFLQCLGLLDHVEEGEILFGGREISRLGEGDRADLRLRSIGFVFQFHHLIPELTALENVLLPSSLAGRRDKAWALELLRLVGLEDKVARYPWQLSGGESQRVAIARALVNRPTLLLTDEATGNLDRPRAQEIVDIFAKINQNFGTTILSVTHDEGLALKYGRRLRLKDGIVGEWTGD